MISRRALVDRLALVVITDPSAPAGMVEAARAATRAGAPAIQLRAKSLPTARLLELALDLRTITRESGALLIVNDRVDVALAAGADGAHLGDDDLPVEIARRIAPPGFLLGRSVDTPEEAAAAAAAGADYLGVGPIYETRTKRDTGPVVGEAGLAAFKAAIGIPLVAIGGISAERIEAVVRAGADGVAVVGAVMSAPEPGPATSILLLALDEARRRAAGGDSPHASVSGRFR